MARQLGGVVLAAFLLFVWGFLYWGISTLPYSAWSHPLDEKAAAQALHSHFPSSGTYFVPGPQMAAAERAALLASGAPATMLHVQYNAPRPGDPMAMVKGFGLNLLFATALALLMFRVRSSSRTYTGRLGVALWAGVAAVLLIDGGDWVWWGTTLHWKLFQAFYDFSAFVIAGAVLAAFIKGDSFGNRFS